MKKGIKQAFKISLKIEFTKGVFCDHVINADENLELTLPKNSHFLLFCSLCGLYNASTHHILTVMGAAVYS